MNQRELARRRKWSIVAAIVLAVVLFGSGLLSGLYASKLIEEQQKKDLSLVEQRQQEQYASLVDYVVNLETDLQNFRIQEQFINSLNQSQACAFAETYFEEAAENLNYYWSVLPARLEEYEHDRELDEEYLSLKQAYTTLSLRAWIISRNNYNKCETHIVPVLYFYSRSCANCLEQGKQLDILREMMEEENKTVVVFTIDYFEEEPALQLIAKYYNVTETPAVIIGERAVDGSVTNATTLAELVR